MAVTITLAQFDSGLYLLGGRESIPANALRVATGVNPVHSRSLRSRNANVRLSTSPAISAARFSGHNYTIDASGNLRQDGGAPILTGLTPGARVSFVKAPPHFGAASYLFGIGGGKAFKIDESGNVTNWGIAAPVATPTASIFSGQAVFLTINQLTSLTGLTVYGATTTLALDSVNFIVSPAAVEITVPGLQTGGFSQTIPLMLNPANSTDFDCIEFYFQCSNPQYITSMTLQFDVNASGFTTNFYAVQIPVGNFLGTQQAPGALDADNLDAVAATYIANHAPTGNPTALQIQYQAAFVAYIKTQAGAIAFQKKLFTPTAGALTNQIVNGLTVTPAGGNWWLARIPRGAFTQFGATLNTNNWNKITGYRFFIVNRHTSDGCSVWFNGLTFGSPVQQQGGGGFGLLGNYSYYYTFGNSVTGHYSNPGNSLNPLNIQNVDRNAVQITGLPTSSSDPQVDTLTLWRTMGNGGIPYRLADIWIGAGGNFSGTFVDCIGDYAGFGPSPVSATGPLPAWTAATLYPAGSLIEPTTGNTGNFCFISNGGISGSNAPNWPQFVGSTVTDGTVTWQNVGTTLLLSLEPMEILNNLPFTTITTAAFINGTMFLCGDTAVGSRGRIYYSAIGFAEGLAGYTDISNDDDPTVGFGIYGGNLYLLTQKAIWLVTDISAGPYQPGWTAIQQGLSPGGKTFQSIVTSPLGLIYQANDNTVVAFDGYQSTVIASQILPLYTGDAVEGYAAIGPIVAATFGRREYWFSDGVGNTFAITMVPGATPADAGALPAAARCHGTAATALYFEPDTTNILAGWNGGTYHLETAGNYNADDGTANLPFTMRTLSFYSGDKYTAKGQRILIDINPGGNTIAISVSVDGTDYFLGNASGSVRAKFEFGFNISGSLIGAVLTSSGGTGQIEVFRIAIEVDISGADDAGTSGGPGQQLMNLLGAVAKTK